MQSDFCYRGNPDFRHQVLPDARRVKLQQKGPHMNNNPLLDVLAREGVLISVSMRYWRAALVAAR